MINVRGLWCILFIMTCRCSELVASSHSLGFTQILKLAAEKHDVSTIEKARRDAYELESINASTFDNPVFSYGIGRLKYNGGTGTADYDEFSISQRININGKKSSIRQQGRILGKLGEIEGTKDKLALSRSVLLAAMRFIIAREKFQHIKERRKSLMLVSQFIKSRKFTSPKKKIEIKLIENKLDEVLLETNNLVSSLRSSKEIMKLYIGDFEKKAIENNFLTNERVEFLAKKIAKNSLIETKIFAHMNDYFEVGESAANKKWIPDLELYYTQSAERFSGGNRNHVVGLGIELPLFNTGVNKKNALVAQRQAAKIEYEVKKTKLLSLKKELLRKIRKGLDFLSIYNQKRVKDKERSFQKFVIDFQRGLISAATFLDLEDSVHTIHSRRLENQFEVFESLLNLVILTGDEQVLREML